MSSAWAPGRYSAPSARGFADRAPCFIDDALDDEDPRDAMDTLAGLFKYLRSDFDGRDAHKHMANEPLDVLRHFAGDERLDPQWRAHNLASTIKTLESKRTPIGRLRRLVDEIMPRRRI